MFAGLVEERHVNRGPMGGFRFGLCWLFRNVAGALRPLNWTEVLLTPQFRDLTAHVPTTGIGRPAQWIDATQALDFSAGVSNPKGFRGLSLSLRAILFR